MYVGYAAHGLAVTVAARRRTVPLTGGPAVTAAGLPSMMVGPALTVAGMSRFAGPGQVTGTAAGGLITGGVYRFSRNPQYTGYVLALTGLGLARRSGGVLALAAATAAVYAWWVPVEETALRSTFGEPYELYRRRTARWLGPPVSQ